MSTNTIQAIASELADGSLQLESAYWVHVPLDEGHELRLLRIEHGPGIVAVIARRPMQLTPSEEDALHTALLKLGAETRWTDGFSGGIDEDGSACIAVTLNEPCLPGQLEDVLGRMLERFTAICEAARAGAFSVTPGERTRSSQPSFTWGLP